MLPRCGLGEPPKRSKRGRLVIFCDTFNALEVVHRYHKSVFDNVGSLFSNVKYSLQKQGCENTHIEYTKCLKDYNSDILKSSPF